MPGATSKNGHRIAAIFGNDDALARIGRLYSCTLCSVNAYFILMLDLADWDVLFVLLGPFMTDFQHLQDLQHDA